MPTYIRIVDCHRNTLNAYKDICYHRKDSIKNHHIKIVENYTKDDIEWKCNYLKYWDESINYPVYVQVVKSNKYKNGNITKKVIFEKRLDKRRLL